MFKMFRVQKSLKIIFETFIVTLPALINVGGLLLLLLYIFSVLAMDLFADLKLNPPISENMNYQTIFRSSLTLFVMSTGEAFYDFMSASNREQSIVF